jgi:hypothetical protein
MRVCLEPLLALPGTEGVMDAQMLQGKRIAADWHAAYRIFCTVIHHLPFLVAHRLTRRNRNALPITDTELKLMAAAAIMGDSSRPKKGYNTPAATGTPSEL